MNELAVEVMLDMVAERGVTLEDMASGTRAEKVVVARRLAVYALRQNTHMSFPEIARAIGKNTHTTVVAINGYVESAMRARPETRRIFEEFACRHQHDYLTRRLRGAKTETDRRRIKMMIARVLQSTTERIRLLNTFGLDTLGCLTREETEKVIKSLKQENAA